MAGREHNTKKKETQKGPFIGICNIPVTVWSVLHIFSNFILAETPGDRDYCLHSADEKTEAQTDFKCKPAMLISRSLGPDDSKLPKLHVPFPLPSLTLISPISLL